MTLSTRSSANIFGEQLKGNQFSVKAAGKNGQHWGSTLETLPEAERTQIQISDLSTKFEIISNNKSPLIQLLHIANSGTGK